MITSRDPLRFDAKTTALVLIDLQHSNVARQLTPHAASDVVTRGARLAHALRAKGATIVYVRVLIGEMVPPSADAPISRPADAPPPPANASELVPEAGVQAGDHIVSKRQWGAFYATELDQILRRKGIRTVVLGGIATNFGVESTARAAYDRAFQVVFAHDAMSSIGEGAHDFAVRQVFPRFGHVRSVDEIVAAAD